MMDPVSLITYAKDAKSVASFVFGNALKEAVSMIVGDVHIDAANLALGTTANSLDPKARLNSVITHLEAAHAAYARVHRQNNRFIKRTVDWALLHSAVYKDVWVCCLMALCFAALGERYAVINSLNLASRALNNKKIHKYTSFTGTLIGTTIMLPLSILNPRTYVYLVRSHGTHMTGAQFLAFRDAILTTEERALPRRVMRRS